MGSTGLLALRWAAALLVLLSSRPAAGVSSAQQLISAALQYTTSSGSPAVPPPNSAGIKFANDSTKVFASVSPPAGQLYAPPGPPPLPPCWSFLKAQTFDLPGQWVNHHDDAYMGEYDMTADCPAWLHDYDCQHPPPSEHVDPATIKQEYRKIFAPDECALAPFDPTNLAAKLGAGRRLIMLGDSLMRLHFYSLACLLRDHITAGSSGVWDASSLKWKGNYAYDWGGGQNGTVAKQFVGEFHLASGGSVYLRDTGEYNQSLFDDLLSDFGALTPNDVLIVNWSAWYHRFQWGLDEVMPLSAAPFCCLDPCFIFESLCSCCSILLPIPLCIFEPSRKTAAQAACSRPAMHVAIRQQMRWSSQRHCCADMPVPCQSKHAATGIDSKLTLGGGGAQVAWTAWQKDMYQLFTERLCKLSAQVFWKQHAPPHFGGPSGTETGCAALL
jgi:hypothetical protein